jgi:hypothetical protein
MAEKTGRIFMRRFSQLVDGLIITERYPLVFKNSEERSRDSRIGARRGERRNPAYVGTQGLEPVASFVDDPSPGSCGMGHCACRCDAPRCNGVCAEWKDLGE